MLIGLEFENNYIGKNNSKVRDYFLCEDFIGTKSEHFYFLINDFEHKVEMAEQLQYLYPGTIRIVDYSSPHVYEYKTKNLKKYKQD